MRLRKLITLLLLVPWLAAPSADEGTGASAEAPIGYLRGQLHAHSDGSGDSNTPPAVVLQWYAEHGFDFVVLTDHNTVTELPAVFGILAIPGIELTFSISTCNPPPEPGLNCALHLNGLFVQSPHRGPVGLALPPSMTRLDIFRQSLAVARDLDALVQINHPNYHYSVDAELIVALANEGAQLLEIANESIDVNNGGDADHPSTVALWDAALTAGAHIWGVATDDAHHYHDDDAVRAAGNPAFVGDRGFVMVRAARDPEAIRAAVLRGDFYSSNGVYLARDERVGEDWTVEVSAESPGDHTLRLIGEGGRVLQEVTGRAATFDLSLFESSYWRVEVTDTAGRTAWTQPTWP